jgi:hypothetical protein
MPSGAKLLRDDWEIAHAAHADCNCRAGMMEGERCIAVYSTVSALRHEPGGSQLPGSH